MSAIANVILTPNRPDIVSEKFEEEYILVSLKNGNYYSLRGTAADVWAVIEEGCTKKGLLDSYQNHFNLTGEEIGALEGFLKDLIEQDLVQTKEAPLKDLNPLTISSGSTYEVPVVESYSDMQDLLLLDPIHDVDEETGWPTQPDAEESK